MQRMGESIAELPAPMPQPSPCLLPATLPPSATAWFVPPAFDPAAALAATRSLGKHPGNSCGCSVHHRRPHGGQHVTKNCVQ